MPSPFPFPEIIDSTARKDLVACPYKFFIHRVRKLKPKGISPHLHFGGAYAHGLEITRKAFYDKDLPLETALRLGGEAIIKFWGDYEPPDYGSAANKTLMACCELHTDYFRQYPPEEDFLEPVRKADGTSAVEFTFALPIPGIFHPQTGEPIRYAGRFDMLANNKTAGGVFINDEKTTGQLGDHWAKSWRLASQMTGYSWAASQFGYSVAGVSIRGASVQKKDIKHLQLMEQRDNWMIERWLVQLQRDVKRAIRMWEADEWDLNLDDACTNYGGCSLIDVCTSKNAEIWLENDFEDDTWNPLDTVD